MSLSSGKLPQTLQANPELLAALQVLLGTGNGTPQGFVTKPYAASLALTGTASANFRIIATNDMTVAIPSSPADGTKIELWITASGRDIQLNLANGFVVPTSSSLTFPVTIPNGKKSKLVIDYDSVKNGGQWEVRTYIPGY